MPNLKFQFQASTSNLKHLTSNFNFALKLQISNFKITQTSHIRLKVTIMCQLQKSASKKVSNFNFKLQTSAASSNFKIQLQTSSSKLSFKLVVQTSKFKYNTQHKLIIQMQLFHFQSHLQNSTSNFNSKLQLQISDFKAELQTSNFSSKLQT